jgi:hypothetical protein
MQAGPGQDVLAGQMSDRGPGQWTAVVGSDASLPPLPDALATLIALDRAAPRQSIGKRRKHCNLSSVGVFELAAHRFADDLVDLSANSALFADRGLPQKDADFPVLRRCYPESAHRSVLWFKRSALPSNAGVTNSLRDLCQHLACRILPSSV